MLSLQKRQRQTLASFGIGLKEMYISSVSLEWRLRGPTKKKKKKKKKKRGRDSIMSQNVPVTVRNELILRAAGWEGEGGWGHGRGGGGVRWGEGG